MHKRKTNFSVIRAGFDSKLTDFVSDLNTFVYFYRVRLFTRAGMPENVYASANVNVYRIGKCRVCL